MVRLLQLWSWLKWPVALSLICYLYISQRQAVFQIGSAPKSWGYLWLALLILLATYLVTFMRWWLLVRAQRFSFSPFQAIRLGFIGLVSNILAPGAVGGDIVRAVLIAKNQRSRRSAAVATVILDRLVGLQALFLVGALASFVPMPVLDRPALYPVRLLMWSGSVLGLTLLVLILRPQRRHSYLFRLLEGLPGLGGMFSELTESLLLYQSRPAVVWLALSLGLICQIGQITGFYCCALWINDAWVPSLVSHFFFLPSAQLFAAFIPLPAGTGALEGAMQWFYGQVRPPDVSLANAGAAGFLAAVAFRVATLAIAAFGGVYYFIVRREIVQAMADDDTPRFSG